MKRFLLFISALFLLSMTANAQQPWSLEQCVAYAQSHNIQIKQSAIQARLNKLTLKQSQLSRIPSLSGGGNSGYNFGRSIDPTTNQFVNNQLFFFQANLNMSMNLFSGFQKNNTIKANRYAAAASDQLLESIKNNVALNVASAYLQILLDEEQYEVSKQEVQLSISQLQNTIKQVVAGALPESNQADLESQVASDSANLVTAKNNLTMSILQMKALLNLDFDTPFSVDTVHNIDAIPLISLADNPPQKIYDEAVGIEPNLLADSFTVLSDQKSLAAAKGALYPSLFLSGSFGTSYASSYPEYSFDTVMIPSYQIGTVNVNGADYKVNSLPESQTITIPHTSPFGQQLNANFNQSIAIGLNIPIFNGWSNRANVERAKLNLLNQQLTTEQDKLTLKQNIYQAYADAKGSLEQYNASMKALTDAQISYDYATQRYNLGLITSVDYLTTENNLFKAQVTMLSDKYNYVFKMKVLEFYKTLNVHF
jgi:outer membrane protein